VERNTCVLRSYSLWLWPILVGWSCAPRNFPIPLTRIANNQSGSQGDRTERRRHHEENRPVNRPLTFLGGGFRVSTAHRASLGKRRRCPQSQKQHGHGNFLVRHHFTPIVITRSASGKKKKYMMMKHETTDKVIIQRISAFSNFRCMK